MKKLLTVLFHIMLAVSTFSAASVTKAQTYNAIQAGLEVSEASVTLENAGYCDYVDVHLIARNGASTDVQKTAAWSVDNNSIALADSGRILALNKGSTVVTAAYNGYKVNISVTVKNDDHLETRYALNGGSVVSAGWASAVNPDSRKKILQKCSDMVNCSWTPTKEFVGFDHFIFKPHTSYTGIPYTYSDDLCDDKAFASKLSSKYFYKSIVIKGVSQPYYGSDCSGFVSLAWNLPERYNTETLIDGIKSGTFAKVGSYSTSSPSESSLKKAYAHLQPGDAVVMREGTHGHTFIIADNEPDMSPPQIFAYEQTPPYCQFTNHTYAEMASHGYMPFTLKSLK